MYSILLNGEVVGQAQVEKEGLYYRFTCTCTFSDGKIHRIVVSDGKSVVKLGVCIPDGDQFRLSTKVPAKRLLGETLRFMIESDTTGIPISSGKPFAYLDKLETARLQITNGQAYILID